MMERFAKLQISGLNSQTDYLTEWVNTKNPLNGKISTSSIKNIFGNIFYIRNIALSL